MKISACIITKNEASVIKRCIDSFKDVVSEIIVVDSGSTDDTCEIAASLGAKIYFRPWTNDFAAARNYCLSKASCPYIIFLDADEYFDESSDIKKTVKQLERNPNTDALSLQMQQLEDGVCQVLTPSIRIFRRSPNLIYKYKIHEGLIRTDSPLRVMFIPTTLSLLKHTGYDSTKSYWKCKRNLPPLLEELESGAARGNIHFYLSDCYKGLEQYSKAIEHAEKLIATGYTMGVYNPLVYYSLVSCAQKMDDISLHFENIQRAANACPKQSLFTYLLGARNFCKGQTEKALEFLLLAREKFDAAHDPKSFCAETDLQPDLLPSIIFLTARTYYALGDKQQAIKYIRELDSSMKRSRPTLSLLLHIADDVSHVQQLISDTYDMNSIDDVQFLVSTLITRQFYELNNQYLKLYTQLRSQQPLDANDPTDLLVHAFNLFARGAFDGAISVLSKTYIISFSDEIAAAMIAAYILGNRPPFEARNFLHPSFKRIVQIYDQSIDGKPITVRLPSEDSRSLSSVVKYLLDFDAHYKLFFAVDYLEKYKQFFFDDLFTLYCGCPLVSAN